MRRLRTRSPRVLARVLALLGLAGATGLAALPTTAVAPAAAGPPAPTAELEFLGRWISGDAGNDEAGGAEIADFDPITKRLFVTNAGSQSLDIVDASNPAAPTLFERVLLSRPIQSVAVHGSLVAVVVEGTTRQMPGEVRVFDTAGAPQWTATTGALPDMVTFTPDGTKLVIANEGEPNTYCSGGTDPDGSISIVDVATHAVSTASFVPWNDDQALLESAGVRIFGPNATVAQDLEPEYITISNDSTTAWVTLQENNALARVDLPTATVTEIDALGTADHNSGDHPLDTSDRDSSSEDRLINIVDRPIQGMYMPDSIASYQANDQTYLVTANEGDAREYGCLLGGGTATQREDPRISAIGLDTTEFPNNEVSNGVLGRLRATLFEPATFNESGQFTSVHSFGTRSFSIRETTGALVWDSADAFEQQTKVQIPNQFNAEWSSGGTVSQFDERSPAKGPEPEGLAVGSAYGKTFAFVGLERPGGVFLYDITDPASPSFVQYVNTSNFAGNYVTGAATAAAGDVAPEGLHFVPASESPTGKPWVIVSYELSGTVGIFQLNGPPGPPTGLVAVSGNAKAQVRFVPPASDGGSPITGYVATCGSQTATGTASPITVTGLTNGTTVSCTVRAENEFGPGEESAPVSVRIGVPYGPTVVTAAQGPVSGSIKLDWNTAQGNGAPVSSYLATCIPAETYPGMVPKSVGVGSAVRTVTITGLFKGRSYHCFVSAKNSRGTGPTFAASPLVLKARP